MHFDIYPPTKNVDLRTSHLGVCYTTSPHVSRVLVDPKGRVVRQLPEGECRHPGLKDSSDRVPKGSISATRFRIWNR